MMFAKDLEKLTKSLTSLSVRCEIKVETIEKVVRTAKLEKAKKADANVNLLIECVRVLRNLVAGVPSNQKVVAELLNSAYDIWDLVFYCLEEIESGNKSFLTLLRCTIQLIGNLAVGNSEFQADNLWKINSVAYQIFTRTTDLRSKNYICMVILNLIQNEELFASLENSHHGGRSREENAGEILAYLPIWLELLESQTDGESCEFALFCLQAIVCSHPYFSLLSLDSRLALLDIVADVVEKDDPRLSSENLLVLSQDFQRQSDVILTTNQGSVDQLRPRNVSDLLLILAQASASEKHRPTLQSERSLLINAVYLLKMVHSAGKAGTSGHTPMSKLSELEQLEKDSEQVENNPTFGFKANLIRLIANLAWKHRENQSLVGELDGVALILDCSQIDGRNPLITQWVVMAIKALCTDHQDNQSVLAGLRREGAADKDLLKELDIHVDEETGKIKMNKKTE